jgi:hypothetical protein
MHVGRPGTMLADGAAGVMMTALWTPSAADCGRYLSDANSPTIAGLNDSLGPEVHTIFAT